MARNKLICGLSETMVVVEAGVTGGTLAAGRECLKQGKHTLVVERSDPHTTAPGNVKLIEEGAFPLRSTEEIKAILGRISDGMKLSRDYLESLSGTFGIRQMPLLKTEINQ